MSTQNLINEEAKKKLVEMAESIDFALMATGLEQPPFHTIPMSTKSVDEKGCIWFLSGKDSTKNSNIESDGRVQLNYADASAIEFLTVYGLAEIVTDKSKLKELYGSSDDAWFDGVNDPNLSAIKVTPCDVHYWDPKNGKLITMFHIGVGAITGDKPDLMDQGELSIN